MFRKILEFIVSRSYQTAGTSRNFNAWKFYKEARNFCWRCKYEKTGYKKLREPKVFFAFAATFTFKDFGISDERYHSGEKSKDEFDARDDVKKGWEVLREEKDFRALRRRLPGGRELYEYKCAGTYWDISPRSFLDAQNDIAYRTEWDSNIITLELIQEEKEHELLRWVSKFPYPLNAREYVYARRTWVSEDRKIAVVESEVVPEEVVPSKPNTKNVRVATYTSRMAIRAHKNWDEHGVDYILTYSDNPEANIPRYIYNWMVNQGGPYFLKQVHKAALEIEKSGREIKSVLERIISYEKKEEPAEVLEEVAEMCDEKADDSEKKPAEKGKKEEQDEPSKKKEIIPGLAGGKSKTSQKLCA